MTVNKALSQLAKAGLIERRRRSGSFVSRPRSQAAILEIHDIKAEVQALGLPYRYELVSHARVRRATAADRAASRCGRRQRSVELVLPPLRRRDSRSAWRAADQPGRRAGSRRRELCRDRARAMADRRACRGAPPSTASARPAADAATAAALDIAAGSPAWWSNGSTWSADQPVTHGALHLCRRQPRAGRPLHAVAGIAPVNRHSCN